METIGRLRGSSFGGQRVWELCWEDGDFNHTTGYSPDVIKLCSCHKHSQVIYPQKSSNDPGQ